MILPLLAPLFGSLLGPSLFGAGGLLGMGMGNIMAGALGSGIASLAATGDPKEALKSGALSYGLGNLGRLMTPLSGGASTASAATDAAAKAAREAALKAGQGSLATTAQIGAKAPLEAVKAIKAAPVASAVRYTAPAAVAPPGFASGIGAIMRNPATAARLAMQNPLSVAAPIAVGFIPGDRSAPIRPGTQNKDPNRPEGGYRPIPREIVPYAGNMETYGQGPEHTFFRDAAAQTAPGTGIAVDLSGMDNYGGGLYPGGGYVRDDLQYQPFARGGHVRGPGGPTDDLIPAMLSNNEHVIDAKTVKEHFGDGSMDKGHKKLDAIRAKTRKKPAKKRGVRKMAEGGRVLEEPADAPGPFDQKTLEQEALLKRITGGYSDISREPDVSGLGGIVVPQDRFVPGEDNLSDRGPRPKTVRGGGVRQRTPFQRALSVATGAEAFEAVRGRPEIREQRKKLMEQRAADRRRGMMSSPEQPISRKIEEALRAIGLTPDQYYKTKKV